jgi:hypothetical protein
MQALDADSNGMVGSTDTGNLMVRKVLLVCGILSSVLYFVMTNILGPLLWDSYSLRSNWVSELFAFGAPSRSVIVPLGIVYQVLMTAFGLGVLLSDGRNRKLRVAGALLVAYGAVGITAPFFSMHMREYLKIHGPALTDTMHKILTGVTVLLMFLAIAFGAAALGRRFRLYSIATIATLLLFGVLTMPAASRVEKGLPTPWTGLMERISIGVFLIWVVVLAIALLRAHSDSHP